MSILQGFPMEWQYHFIQGETRCLLCICLHNMCFPQCLVMGSVITTEPVGFVQTKQVVVFLLRVQNFINPVPFLNYEVIDCLQRVITWLQSKSKESGAKVVPSKWCRAPPVILVFNPVLTTKYTQAKAFLWIFGQNRSCLNPSVPTKWEKGETSWMSAVHDTCHDI